MNEIWQYVQTTVSENEFFSGGLLIGAFGTILVYLRNLPSQLYRGFLRVFTHEVTFLSSDKSFQYLETLLLNQGYNKRCKRLMARVLDKDPVLIPSYGVHFFFYKKRLIVLSRTKEDIDAGSGMSFHIRDEINLRIFSRNKNLVTDLLLEAQELVKKPKYEKTVIYGANYGNWYKIQELELVNTTPILPNGKFQEIVDDIKLFLSSQDDYKQKGIPYKRGYMFYGPPGSGKSSTVLALAQALKKDILFINLGKYSLSDDEVERAFVHAKENSIICLEDIDSLNSTHDRDSNDDGEEKVTIGQLLNILDGFLTKRGQIIFATTNHYDKLDQALIRPGRFDVTYEFKNATKQQAKDLWIRFFGEEKAEEFAERIEDYKYSMAQLQSHFLKYGSSLEHDIE